MVSRVTRRVGRVLLVSVIFMLQRAGWSRETFPKCKTGRDIVSVMWILLQHTFSKLMSRLGPLLSFLIFGFCGLAGLVILLTGTEPVMHVLRTD